MLRLGESDTAALGETFGRSPLTGIELVLPGARTAGTAGAIVEGKGMATPEARSRASGLRLPARGKVEPFLGMRTSAQCSLTSADSRSTLLRRIIASPSPLVPLGMRISQRCAFLKRRGRSAQHR